MLPPAARPRRGLFFSFEGIDGSGKSTQARLLAEALQKAGHEVVSVREPGGTPLGERVRTLLLDPGPEVVPEAELLLFSAARAQLVQTVIVPALQRGAVVVADRYVDSSSAYQGAGRQLGGDRGLTAVVSVATGGVMPDRTYLVVVSLEESERRRQDRAADRIEQALDGFSERVADAYARIATEHPERVLRVDGTLPSPVLHALIADDAFQHVRSASGAAAEPTARAGR